MIGMLPPARVDRGSVPEPDSLVIHPDFTPCLGVEVTELQPLGQKRRLAQSEGEGIVQAARRIYLADGGPELFVSVNWSEEAAPAKVDRRPLAEQLATFVRERIPQDRQRLEFDRADWPEPPLPVGVDRVTINRLVGFTANWSTPSSGFVPAIARSDIEEALERKRLKPLNYKAPYAQRWLLLVTGAGGRATWGRVQPDQVQEPFESSYERVFLLTTPFPECTELKIQFRPAAA